VEAVAVKRRVCRRDKQFLTQKSIAEMERPPYFPALAPNDFWLFPEIVCLKGRSFQDTEDVEKM
jgi:hypothetical protein